TADLAEGGMVVTPIENNRRAQALRKLAATVPPAGTNVVVITHKPNILDAFGKDWFDVREGEASVFQPGGGGYKLIVRVPVDECNNPAQPAANGSRRQIRLTPPTRPRCFQPILALGILALELREDQWATGAGPPSLTLRKASASGTATSETSI